MQWKGSAADSGVNLGYKGKTASVMVARGAVMIREKTLQKGRIDVSQYIIVKSRVKLRNKLISTTSKAKASLSLL